MDLRHRRFLVKMYAKTKELGPAGGRAPGTPPDPPMFWMKVKKVNKACLAMVMNPFVRVRIQNDLWQYFEEANHFQVQS